jgi:cell division protein FtsB
MHDVFLGAWSHWSVVRVWIKLWVEDKSFVVLCLIEYSMFEEKGKERVDMSNDDEIARLNQKILEEEAYVRKLEQRVDELEDKETIVLKARSSNWYTNKASCWSRRTYC